jgi:hypothetical protein
VGQRGGDHTVQAAAPVPRTASTESSTLPLNDSKQAAGRRVALRTVRRLEERPIRPREDGAPHRTGKASKSAALASAAAVERGGTGSKWSGRACTGDGGPQGAAVPPEAADAAQHGARSPVRHLDARHEEARRDERHEAGGTPTAQSTSTKVLQDVHTRSS